MDSDKEYDELCDAIQRRDAANRRSADEEDIAEGNDEELAEPHVDQRQQEIENMHCDLVTPEQSAEEKQAVTSPPKLSHKRSKSKKRSPTTDRRRKSSRKLEYHSPQHEVPLHRAIKRKLLDSEKKKKTKKRPKRCASKKTQLQERTVQQDGTWVQCMRSECQKWRCLRDVNDPSLVPDYWVCEQNTDLEHNSCEHPEEDYQALEFVFTKFAEGSIVLAKMQGYPWWPAMIEEDPDTGTYLEEEIEGTYPTHYHVVFLDKTVSRTWLRSTFIRKFETDDNHQTRGKGKDFKQQIGQAMERAKTALAMNVQERIRTFGFSHTFKGKIVNDSPWDSEDDEKDARPNSKDEVEKKEEEQKQDVTYEPLDLEALGVDMDEILEQAESLLSEAGETMLSLQDTPQGHVPTKKSKGDRKRKQTSGEESAQEEKDLKCKKKTKHSSKLDRAAVDGHTEEKKHKTERRHHKHSKKAGKVGDSRGLAETESDVTRNNNKAENANAEDIKGAAPNEHKNKTKSSKSKTVQKDEPETSEGSKEHLDQPQDDTQVTAAGDMASLHGESDQDFEPQAQKAKPKSKRDKISGDECSTKKVKKPRLKKCPVPSKDADQATPACKESNGDGKLQKARKPRQKKPVDGKEEQKPKRPRAKKVANLKADDKSKTLASDPEASDVPQKQGQGGKSKKKRKEKDEAVPKRKPSFKPPSKIKAGVSLSESKQASQSAPATVPCDMSSEKEKQEEITTDATAGNPSSQSPTASPAKILDSISSDQKEVTPITDTPQKPQKQKKDDKTKAKAKFSIKKAAQLSNSSKSSISKDISKTGGTSGVPIDKDEPTDASTRSDKPKAKKLKEADGKKVAAPKKFSIKRKAAATAAASSVIDDSRSHQGKTSTASQELGGTKTPNSTTSNSSSIETSSTDNPTKSSQKSKKFSIKRKPECSSAPETQSHPKDGASPSESKTVTPRPVENMQQQNDSDSDIFLDLEAVLPVDGAAMEVGGGDGGADHGSQDSDDFSIEDLEDWPRDLDKTKLQSPTDDLNKLASAQGAESQPFQLVEE